MHFIVITIGQLNMYVYFCMWGFWFHGVGFSTFGGDLWNIYILNDI